MFSSFRNLLSTNFDYYYRKRRASDNACEPPPKIVKYTRPSVGCLQNIDMSHIEKENKADDEINVISEVKSKEWITPRGSIRRKVEDFKSSTPISSVPSPSYSPGWQAIGSRTEKVFDVPDSKEREPEVEVIRSIRHVPIERTGKPAKRLTSEKLFASFKHPPTRFSQAMKRRQQTPNTLCSMKFLSEKMTYRKLLEMHQSPFGKPFQFTDFKSIKEGKKEVPVIDLESDMKSLRVNRSKETQPPRAVEKISDDIMILEERKATTSRMQPTKSISSLQEYIRLHSIPDTAISQILTDHAANTSEKRRQSRLEEARLSVLSEHNKKSSSEALEQQIRDYMKITEPPVLEVIDEPAVALPELTAEQVDKVNKALRPTPAKEVLTEKFKITITRHDLSTLKGLNWLNDEVINFYMSLLMERAEKPGMPKVYTFNTFFYQNLTKGRFSTLKRWTRKVDLFSYDMVFAPIHLGMHWCMSAIDFRAKEIRYYDSMGSPNDTCLDALQSYLQEESMDKRKKDFDLTGWKKINVSGIPQQMNGSDCGVFACMFAEFLSRGAPLTFDQDDMPYFRQKMALEILEGTLIT